MIATSIRSASDIGAVTPSAKNTPVSVSANGQKSAGEPSSSQKTFQNVFSQMIAQEQSDSQATNANAPVLSARSANRKTDASDDDAQTPASDTNSSNPMTAPVNSALVQIPVAPAPSPLAPKDNALSKATQGPKNGAAAALGLGNLQGSAFAMRITSAKSNNPTERGQGTDQTPQNGTDASDSGSASSGLATAQTAHAQSFVEVATAAGVVPTAYQPTSIGSGQATSSTATPRVTANAAASPADATTTIGDEPVNSSAQVRSLQVQVNGASGTRVDLRFVETGGGLSLSVRSSDNALTRGLQDNLPELTSRLADEKYQTHVFLPTGNEGAAELPSTSVSSSSNSSGSSQQQQNNGSTFSQQDGSASGGNSGRQQNGQSEETAAWWRQLAALGKLSSSTSSSYPTSANTPANS